MAASQKLKIKRDEGRYNYSTGDYDDPPGTEAENKKIVVEFLRDAIESAGFSTIKKSYDGDDPYQSNVRVYIKNLTGNCYLEACYSYTDLGGDPSTENEISVENFTLGSDDYPYELNETYSSRAQIIKKLAKDINKNLGSVVKFNKLDARNTSS
jgi:hypothetical protein